MQLEDPQIFSQVVLVQLSVSQPDDSIILWKWQLFSEESVIFNSGMALRPFGKKCWGKWPQCIKGPFIS